LAVSIKPTAEKFLIPWTGGCVTAGAIAEVSRRDNGDPVPVDVTLSGQGGTKTYRVTLGGKGKRTFGYTFQACQPGRYEVTVEAWPDPRNLESRPGDNTASCWVVVEKMPPPPPSKGDVHVEIGGGGGTGERVR
ncbi:MAG: hypothetical protein ACUVSP_09765, partial [Desulfotomaculales bacterium]